MKTLMQETSMSGRWAIGCVTVQHIKQDGKNTSNQIKDVLVSAIEEREQATEQRKMQSNQEQQSERCFLRFCSFYLKKLSDLAIIGDGIGQNSSIVDLE